MITSAINFLEQWLDSEQEVIIKTIKDICFAKSPTDFTTRSRPLLASAGISWEQVKEFSDIVFETYPDFRPSTDLLEKDYSIRLLSVIRKNTGLVRKLLFFIIVVSV